MPELTAKEVHRIAGLARLRLEPDEVERFRGDLVRILTYFSALEAVDVTDVPPTAHVIDPVPSGRDDEPSPCLPRDRALRAAPDPAAGHFRVPRVLR